jgi:hypothetical protein
MRGAEIRQLREQLTRLSGKSSAPDASDVYDGELAQLV